MRALVIAVAIAALVFASGAAAHGDGAARGFRSTVTGIEPAVEGLDVRVLDADDRLFLTNDTGETVIVKGYGQEPYLKFEDGTVFQNVNSATVYLNKDRYGGSKPPDDLDLDAPPEWKAIAKGNSYEWHDHRIHWMSLTDPDVVVNDRGSEHHLFDWSIPLEVDGETVKASGRLDYAPPSDSRSAWLYGGIGLALVGCVAAAVALRRRKAS